MTRRHGHGVIAIAIAQQGRQLAILSWRRRCRVVLAMGSRTIVCCCCYGRWDVVIACHNHAHVAFAVTIYDTIAKLLIDLRFVGDK